MKNFTAADIDRILGLADQFLEDWELHEGKNENEPDAATVKERREEWNALRPQLLKLPELQAFAEQIARMNWDGEELADGTTADISNDDNHETMIGLIEEARTLTKGA